MTPAIAQLLQQLDQAYDHKSWHGTNLRGSLRRVTPALAAWRPAPGRHNIWEEVVHAAYWKYAVWRRLTGERRGSFPLAGSNWFKRPEPAAAVPAVASRMWHDDLALLRAAHLRLREAVQALPPATLHRRPPGGTVTRFDLVIGIVAHDLYHAGQIQLIKALGPRP